MVNTAYVQLILCVMSTIVNYSVINGQWIIMKMSFVFFNNNANDASKENIIEFVLIIQNMKETT